MRRLNWKLFLPIMQLALALAGLIYGPHEYRVKARLDHAVDNLAYTSQNYPALAERIAQGINFPALVLAYPVRKQDAVLYKHNSEYTLIWITPRDLGFYVGILLFWYCVGRILDDRQGQGPTARFQKVRFAGVVCGLAFGMLTGAYAFQMIESNRRPDRQIGTFGIVWSLTLLAYFTWRFAIRCRARLLQS
jgi:hypothetical protein